MKGRIRITLILVGLLVVLGGTWLTREGIAFNPQPEPPGSFGTVGITVEQTARLNVVHVPGKRAGMDPVTLRLAFFDDMGDMLSEVLQKVAPGESAHLDLRGIDALFGRDGRRAQIHAMVTLAQRAPRADPMSQWIATLEVFDEAMEKTEFVHPTVLADHSYFPTDGLGVVGGR